MEKNKRSQQNRCVLFDLDGVIARSEEIKSEIHVQTCLELGGTPSPELHGLYKEVMGTSSLEARRAFLRCACLEPSPEMIQSYQDVYRGIFSGRLDDIRCTQGAEDLLRRLKSYGCRIGLVSSSRSEVIQTILANNGVDHYFSAVVSSEMVDSHKPSPEPYLKALELLGFDDATENVLVIEDSWSGITAAKNAGLTVIALRHDMNEKQNLEGADHFVDSLEDERLWEIIEQVIGIHA